MDAERVEGADGVTEGGPGDRPVPRELPATPAMPGAIKQPVRADPDDVRGPRRKARRGPWLDKARKPGRDYADKAAREPRRQR